MAPEGAPPIVDNALTLLSVPLRMMYAVGVTKRIASRETIHLQLPQLRRIWEPSGGAKCSREYSGNGAQDDSNVVRERGAFEIHTIQSQFRWQQLADVLIDNPIAGQFRLAVSVVVHGSRAR